MAETLDFPQPSRRLGLERLWSIDQSAFRTRRHVRELEKSYANSIALTGIKWAAYLFVEHSLGRTEEKHRVIKAREAAFIKGGLLALGGVELDLFIALKPSELRAQALLPAGLVGVLPAPINPLIPKTLDRASSTGDKINTESGNRLRSRAEFTLGRKGQVADFIDGFGHVAASLEPLLVKEYANFAMNHGGSNMSSFELSYLEPSPTSTDLND